MNEEHLWYGGNPNLVALDLETKEQVIFEVPNSQEIWSFYEDDKKRLWYSWFGLQAFDIETQTVEPTSYNEFSELTKHPIYHFYTKKDGNMLLCARSGLYEWHPDTGVLARYWKEGKGQFKLPVSDIRHLYYDNNDNSYWLATGNKGLVHWLPESSESKTYQLHRYHSNTVHSVYPDAYDNLWLSTDNGIVQFNKTTAQYKVYLPADGTSSHEFNRISHFQDKDSTIYFGSIDGVTIVQPKDFAQVNFEEAKTEVVILEVEQYLAKSSRLENITPDFYKKQKITMQSGDRFFTLLLTLNNPKYLSDVIYQYRLKGVDDNWTTAKSNELSISGIPYGNQILEIRASMANGQFTKILGLKVRVLRPFYLTWWFWLSIAIIGTGLTVAGIRWRTQQLQAQQVFLQNEVEKRTATIKKQAEELQALDQTKSRFFANVSHELRTPLTLILGPIKSTLSRGNLDNRDFTMLEKANQSGQQLLKLVGSILDLSKMEANRIELKEESVILFPFIRRLVAAFESHAQREGIRFSFNYQAEKDLQLILDKDKLEVILNNLLSNAMKFTQKGGQVAVDLKDETNHILISVKDTGRGIHPDDLPNVFDRFYQTKRKEAASEGGTGIGLALSKEFVKLMQVELWVESEWTQGSTFFLQLPRNEVLGMVEMPKEALQTTKSPTTTLNTETETSTSANTEQLLIVEDNHALRDYIKLILEPHYRIKTAENGQVALDFLIENEQKKQPQPNLIISDVMMPEMDGFQLLTVLKSRDYFRNIPVVMLTARAESKDRLHALRVGVDDYLLKPFDEEELLVRIENLLSNAEHRSNYQNETQEPTTESTEQTPTISQADSEWLQQLEELLSNRIGEFNLSAEVIAQALFIGRTQLFQKVKQLTGLTLNQYIKEVRLNRARDLLVNPEITTSVKQVAYSVGFKDTKNFSRNFKKRFGKSPSEYL